MIVRKPVLPASLATVEGLAALAAEAQGAAVPLELARFSGCILPAGDLSDIVFSKVEFDHCRLTGTVFRGGSFSDVRFQNCDLSGCDFSDSGFRQCEFNGCKMVGANLSGSFFKDVRFVRCNLQYAAVQNSKLTAAALEESDLSGADLSDCKLKNLHLSGSKFYGTSFYRTPLKGLDFTTCELAGPGVTVKMNELAGAVVDSVQAAQLAALLSLIIR